ncbi:S-adenosyl-L-methionine-dependent methyltransferase [Hypoxylon sp. FL1284]|nr:S-adenosyl-L-methionine-dependent methyltransferase [Hypoxylon sp. FL1284]
MPTSPDPSSPKIRYLPTNEAYDRWATVYDTDGNFLQALDTIELETLLPRLLRAITSPKPWRVVDLGCGTGRATALLLGTPGVAEVTALDSSEGMLQVARSRLQQQHRANDGARPPPASDQALPKLRLELFDMLASPQPPASAQGADGAVSTLVLEHVPLAAFFAHVARVLRPGGVLLLTNMHARMGALSQAGFVDAATGDKIRPTSYTHAVADVVAEAERWGLDVEDGGIAERAVSEDMVQRLGPRSRKWVGVTVWFGGLFRKRGSL